ncbi:MAG TPA: ATP-binding protein [Noviherbaspirillum sp.]|uniref:hybrid sensor histidine kinase/response regulator n=1 Tax=Noviherbaspirillum sp. TaxID=1926288 RepID=UPI002D34C349|nr:ATP-binding protein [Noviherbaspirillum sp.]HYD96129.1 ATP-binding protein [Noviherbaspirillum sp.]
MGEHLVQFYDNENHLVDEIWRFINPCLRLGETALVIASRERLADIEMKYAPSRLTEIGVPHHASPYIALDAELTLTSIMKNGWPDEAQFNAVIGDLMRSATREGQRHVRAYGEMVALLCADGQRDAAIRLEQLWNSLGERFPFSLLCGYPMHAFSDARHSDAFAAVCGAHTHVRPAENGLAPDKHDEQNRVIAMLQQKAHALESEVARCKAIEHSLHQREKELSDFLENAVEGMHRVGPDGIILWANKAELGLLGYAYEEYVGRHIAEFHADRHVIDNIIEKLRAGEALYDYPARMRCRDGSIKHVLIHSNARVAEGEFISTRCLMRDVTERVRLEQELNKRLAQLADMDRRKDEFLAMLGHELRNPLAPIMNSLELMRMHGDAPALVARHRDTIARQVALMTRLVDDLLDVSRITRGKIELKMETIALDQVIERAVEIVRPLIDERNHRLDIRLPAPPVPLRGDTARLAQVLANLLHNAAKYTDPGGCIVVDAGQQDGKRIAIRVRDNGIGLEQALQDKIFDLFVQDAASLNRARGGLGLGLTLVRSLVRMHGGEVRVESEGPGRGSVFTVTLPLEPAASAAPEDGGTEQPLKAQQAPPKTVLIVDDNVDAGESLGEFLKAAGHHVHVATNGKSALLAAARLQPDVVILDIGLPDLDGYQVAQRLRSEIGLTSALLLAVTGYAQERDRVTARHAGFDHHFAKPLDIRRLEQLLCVPDGASPGIR